MGNCFSFSAPVNSHSLSDPKLPATYGVDPRREEKKQEGEIGDETRPVGAIVTPKLKEFTLMELKTATRNFRPDSVLGEGGFGRVFKGWIDPETFLPTKLGVGIPVAVKKSSPGSSQGLREFQSEVEFLGKFTHPNLVKLLGYCMEDRLFLLVYEYVQRGSLENHLFKKGPDTLGWDTRMHIAIGAARGLAFLHTSENSVIFRDFKPSNILLDGHYGAKLSDFGLAKFGPANGDTHVSTQPMGTFGYAAPEYVSSGRLYIKSDLYGFGVVMLEMLTGRRAIDKNRPSGEEKLVDWARPFLRDKRRLRKIVDPKLNRHYPFKCAVEVARLILRCLTYDPRDRPSMDEVTETLEQIRAMDGSAGSVPVQNEKEFDEQDGGRYSAFRFKGRGVRYVK